MTRNEAQEAAARLSQKHGRDIAPHLPRGESLEGTGWMVAVWNHHAMMAGPFASEAECSLKLNPPRETYYVFVAPTARGPAVRKVSREPVAASELPHDVRGYRVEATCLDEAESTGRHRLRHNEPSDNNAFRQNV